MAVTHKLYAKFPLNAAGGDAGGDGPMDLLSDTIKFTLHTSRSLSPAPTGRAAHHPVREPRFHR
jgi:hypothetical protein